MARHRVTRANVPDVVRGSVVYPPDGVGVLALEFLARVAAQPRPRTVAEMNEGLTPEWQARAAGELLAAGLLSGQGPVPRLAVTAAGRAVLDGGHTRKAG